MQSTARLFAPTITFLSPCTVAAARACEKLEQWTAFARVNEPKIRREWGVTWEIHSLCCSLTGTTIQYMASSRSSSTKSGQQSLISVQDIHESHLNKQEQLFQLLCETKSSARLLVADILRRSISPQTLLGSSLTPVVQVQESLTSDHVDSSKPIFMDGVLKEMTLPFFIADRDTSEQLATLPRLTTGLYRFCNGLAIRPLLASQEDHALPPPSLIFHTTKCTLNDEFDPTAIVTKIGCSGTNPNGQAMVRHGDTRGIDVRFCASSIHSSMFCEAQESLLASSLKDLQSTSVLQSTGQADPKTLQADCWVEFRANMKRPMGFVKKTQSKIAKAPSLPYE
ncbi:hypothetical protein MPSEU_000206700 [Mayamaea pseudoterrestris]|nr:hypothetical protein MPSEU_000206700 [Mayamaea pseudoterrestris]